MATTGSKPAKRSTKAKSSGTANGGAPNGTGN